MEYKSGKFWLLKAFGVLLLGLVFWFILAVWTGTSFALDLHFAQDLRSNLLANYGDAPFNQSMKYLSLTILGDAFSDQGISDGSMGLLEELLVDPVPTATIVGDPGRTVQPPTSTPSATLDLTSTAMAAETENSVIISSITETPTPTNTATGTPTSTLTPTSTKTQVPTVTPSPTRKPSQTPVPVEVYPILECVEYKGGGMWTAYFGYKNPSQETQTVPIGDHNRFKPPPEDRGQPTTFLPGRSKEFPEAEFSVEFQEGDVLTWYLTAYSVEASSASEYCDYIMPSPTPTKTTEPQDTQPPTVSGGYLNPEPGFINDCYVYINVDYLLVEDPPYSCGIEWVKLKYIVEGYTSEQYSDPLAQVDGGPTAEGGWSAHYSGSVTVEIDPNWSSPEPDPFTVNLWAKARDKAAHDGFSFLGTYYMPASCGKSSQ